MVVATATRTALSRADIVEWVEGLIEQGKTDQEAQAEVFEEILRDGLSEEFLKLLGVAQTVGSIWRNVDHKNRPAAVLPGWTAKPVEKPKTAEAGQDVRDTPQGPATSVVTPQPTYGAPRIPLSALTRDTSMLSGRYDVPGIGLVVLGEMTKAHCRALADQYLREGRSKLTYAKWFKHLEESLTDEKEQIKAKWDEQRILNLFELSEPKL